MLSIRSLSRVVQGRALVDEVSFEMAGGEVLAILGPSGSGKTSLLRLIAGFDAPSSGSVHLLQRQASGAGKVLMAPEHRSVAVAFQDATLFPHLDAVGNVALAVRQRQDSPQGTGPLGAGRDGLVRGRRQGRGHAVRR
jgi:iron(III) transport system ATP-binding protein